MTYTSRYHRLRPLAIQTLRVAMLWPPVAAADLAILPGTKQLAAGMRLQEASMTHRQTKAIVWTTFFIIIAFTALDTFYNPEDRTMGHMRYVIIDEWGVVYQTDEITNNEKEGAMDGVLTIIDRETMTTYEEGDKWEALPPWGEDT